MPSLFFMGRRWFTAVALIGLIVVSLVIISVYSPPENKTSDLAEKIWGVKKWTKTFGDPSYYDVASSVQQNSDGGYIIIGATGYNASNFTRCASTYLIKTDKDGNKAWENIFGATR